ncbi:MAG: DUF3574 domain-containing protein [Rhizomicrobium sp.]|nr:DUF3574 domain-containing protein [Rhizomicrobium sp.]
MVRITRVILALCLSGGVAVAGTRCPSGLLPMTKAELFFGLSIGVGRQVSDADWQRFTDEVITPRFPDGLTIEDARGQWKGVDGITREGAKHLIIVLPSRDTAKLDAIRAAYKARFHQDSVLLVVSRVCGSF